MLRLLVWLWGMEWSLFAGMEWSLFAGLSHYRVAGRMVVELNKNNQKNDNLRELVFLQPYKNINFQLVKKSTVNVDKSVGQNNTNPLGLNVHFTDFTPANAIRF